MIKAKPLQEGDYVAIVSLSRGVLGEPFAKHQLERGIQRLEAMGLHPIVMPNTLKGIEYLDKHPEARAQDLIDAFRDKRIKAIICAIGGLDTYRTFKHCFEQKDFVTLVRENPKIFTGFSDTTHNHWLFYKLGLVSYYGLNFLNDIAELDTEMLPYTLNTWHQYFDNKTPFEIESSDVWYEERTQFDPQQLDTPRKVHTEMRGYETLRGQGIVEGTLFGGCLESIVSIYEGTDQYPDIPNIYQEYDLIPRLNDFKQMILFLETSESKSSPELFREMIQTLKKHKLLEDVRALVFGKPQNEIYYEEYKQILEDELSIPVLLNVNVGHAYPRTVLPYGLNAQIDFDTKRFQILEPMFETE